MVVLVVDDDPDDAQLLTEVLNEVQPDASIHVATNCTGCLHQLEQLRKPPDLIFLDGKLPGMSSQECYEKLKALPHLGSTHIIIYTGFPKHEAERLFGEMKYYVHKTSSLEELRSAIVQLTSNIKSK